MDELKKEIKECIISALELEDIKAENIIDSEPLFGTGLGLDSIDALELGIALKKKFLAEGWRKLTKDELFSALKKILVEDFDIEESKITPDASIADDLELDSIDAVDMIVKLKPLLDSAIEPAVFKSVRTVQDVVDVLQPISRK